MEEEGGTEQATTETNNVELIASLGEDYSKYLKVDASSEKQQFEESIEEMLTKLDEFCGLVDLIRSDTSLCLNKTLPEIHRKSQQMQIIFDRIDRLEAFVAMVKQNVSQMEEQVKTAEDQMGSLSGIKKVLNNFSLPSFFSKKSPVHVSESSSPSSSSATADYISPTIFNTSEYLSSPSQDDSEGASIPAETSNTGQNDEAMQDSPGKTD